MQSLGKLQIKIVCQLWSKGRSGCKGDSALTEYHRSLGVVQYAGDGQRIKKRECRQNCTPYSIDELVAIE